MVQTGGRATRYHGKDTDENRVYAKEMDPKYRLNAAQEERRVEAPQATTYKSTYAGLQSQQ